MIEIPTAPLILIAKIVGTTFIGIMLGAILAVVTHKHDNDTAVNYIVIACIILVWIVVATLEKWIVWV